ncbi:SEA (Seh1-associated) complex subunit, partial [Coemansia aciculifera]
PDAPTSYPGSSPPSSMQVADSTTSGMQADSSLTDASIRTPTASSSVVEADSVGSTSSLNQSQRPRSRTASPWRGKPRASANIFSRPKANTSRQSATDTQLVLKHDSNSAMAVASLAGSDGSINSSGISSAGLVLERSSTIAGDKPDQYTGQRRRGHTMDHDHFGTRQISTSAGTDSDVAAGNGGAQLEVPAAIMRHTQQPATASHFHVSVNNTALAVRTDRRALQSAYPPTGLAKNDSGSSNHTVTTVELEASASSTHSNEMLDSFAPRGQLSKMLYNNDPREAGGIGGAEPLPPTDMPAHGNTGRSSSATAGLSSTGVLGRTKRGGSGGDSRPGDLKGALGRPQTMNIFSTRSRNSNTTGSSGDKQASSGGLYDDQDLRGGVGHSGSADTSGAHMPSSAEHTMPLARHGQPVRTGVSSGDDLGDDMRSTTTFSHASSTKDSIASGGQQQQPRAVPTQDSASKNNWMYTSPGERPGGDGTTDGPGHRPHHHPAALRAAKASAVSPQHEFSDTKALAMAKSSDSTASATLHNRREGGKAGRAQAGIVPLQRGRSDALPRVPSDVSAHQSHVPGAETYSRNGSGTRLPAGVDPAMFDGEDGDTWQYNQAVNGSTHHQGSGGDDGLPSRPRNPWSLAPSRSHKKMLRCDIPEACNAIAVAPYNEPTCAGVSNEGLFLLTMGPDKILVRNSLTHGRRRSTVPAFSDVVWRPMDYLVTGTKNGKVSVWDPSHHNNYLVRTYSGDVAREIKRLAIKPGDAQFVYGALSDGQIFGWDFRTASTAPALRIPASLLTQDIDTNPLDTNMIAAVTQESRLMIWDVRNPSHPLANPISHLGSAAVCIAWHPSGRFIGTGGTDQSIKIWDMKTVFIKKPNPPSFCSIKTISNPRRLQWRPGHDTQISSCASSVDPRFQVWDMRNPNHSLCCHDKHTDRITGFTWFDENLVWTAGRDKAVIQCDVRQDAVYTAGLVGYSAIDLN